MAKGKAKKKQQQKKKKPAATSGHADSHFAMGVCSITNPFCPEAIGARWPDASSTKSVPYTAKCRTVLPIDANGNGCSYVNPAMNAQWQTGTVTNGTGAVAYSALTFTQFPGFIPPAGFVRYRITSWGVRLTCIGSKMNTIGTVRVRFFSPFNGASLLDNNIGTQSADYILDVPLARLIDKDMYLMPKPLGTDARLFRNEVIQSTIATWNNPGWQLIQIGVEGGQASLATLAIEFYAHYEIVFADNASMQIVASAPPKPSTALQTAAGGTLANIGNSFEGAAQALDSIFNSRAYQYARAGMGMLMGDPRPAARMMIKNAD